MREQYLVSLLVLIFLSGLFSGIRAQTNTDQIVFTEGWVTGFGEEVKYPRYARSEFPADPVIPLLLSDQSIRPADMKRESVVNWKAISADEEGFLSMSSLLPEAFSWNTKALQKRL